jgi:hypothetical protein
MRHESVRPIIGLTQLVSTQNPTEAFKQRALLAQHCERHDPGAGSSAIIFSAL